jgi:hypothetical protein
VHQEQDEAWSGSLLKKPVMLLLPNPAQRGRNDRFSISTSTAGASPRSGSSNRSLDDRDARQGLARSKAFNYMLRRWSSFTRFLDDGRICLSNNAAELALRGIALGRRSWLFCGSDRGGQRAAVLYSLIASAKLNDIDPQAWLADILARIAAHPAQWIDDLLPWNWRSAKLRTHPAAA